MKKFERVVIGIHVFLAVLIVALIIFMVIPAFFSWSSGALELHSFPIVSIEKDKEISGKWFFWVVVI